jgi:uncharacterized protein YcbX
MKVSEIWIYPVKSLSGISLSTAQVQAKGLQYDRRWMLVDENGVFITQRTCPQLALFDVALNESYLCVTYRPNPIKRIEIPFQPVSNQLISVSVWDSHFISARSVSDGADRWFSELLEKKVFFVYMPEDSKRAVNPKYGQEGDVVSFADGYPYLLISQASLNDLNARLTDPVPMNRFRPNFVIEGCNPFAEDSWSAIRMGSLPFDIVKPCSRCVMVTIDQETILKNPEPLKILSSYRKIGHKVMFGQNLISRQTGNVSVGDPVEILIRKV